MTQPTPTPHPPKPRLTLRVGITGHRPNKLTSGDVPRVAEELRKVMTAIESRVAAIYEANKTFYSDAPQKDEQPASDKPYRIRLISGFAEGADQMAVVAVPEEWTVEAILPFPRNEYRKDFEKSAAGDGKDVTREFDASLQRAQVIAELPAPTNPDRRNQGYVMAGGYLLRQVDLLIAVWDGQQPKPGGTGAIAQEAREGGIPVLWISVGAGVKTQFLEHFDNDTPIPSQQPWSEEALKAALEPMLGAPSDKATGRRRSPRGGLRNFYEETWRSACWVPVFDLIKRLANRQSPRLAIRYDPYGTFVANFNKLIDEAPNVEPLKSRLKEILAPRYAWTDALAVHFSHYYRSAYVLAYLLSAVAVLIAVIGAYVEAIWTKITLVGLELFVIVIIVLLVRYGRRRGWHERWIDYRLVAESLRHARFLSYVSEFGRIHQRMFATQPWTIWYIRATLREIGLPNALLDEKYQQPLLHATSRHEVHEQFNWHRGNAAAMQGIEHFLHRWGNRCFLVTLWALFAGLIFLVLVALLVPAGELSQVLKYAKPGFLVVAALLPAVGAALSGIRAHGDFDGSKERSAHMAGELETLTKYYAAAAESPRLEKTADLLIETARVMSEDLAAWQDLYGRKRLSLPA